MFASLFVAVALALFGCVSAAPQKRALAQVYSKCTVPNTVALTFDDGPYVWLYDISKALIAAGGKGTFFFNGNNFHDEMWRVEQALQRICGVQPAFMRPPFGNYNNLVREAASVRGQSLATWDFDSGDSLGVSAQASKNRYNTVAGQRPRTILALNHETVASTAQQVIPYAIQRLHAAGYRLVTVAECLGRQPYQWLANIPASIFIFSSFISYDFSIVDERYTFRSISGNGAAAQASPKSHFAKSIRIRHMGNNQSNPSRVENNINNGAGTYNNVKGSQTINMGGVKFELHTNVGTQRSPPDRNRISELPAPYDLAAYQLVEADRLLREIETGIPSSRKISELRSDIEDFLQVVICVGSAMDFISKTTPQLSSNSFVERITHCAFGWSRHLKQLPADIRGYQTHIGCYIDADSCLRRIFLSIFEDYRWRPWLRNLRAFVRRSSFSSKVSLAVLSTPACKKIFGEALRSLIKESNLLSTPEVEHLTDLQQILSHLCQDGPEEDYIYLGNWEIVHIEDDMVVDKDLFAKTVKSEMRFDISIIVQSRSASSHTCPHPSQQPKNWTARFRRISQLRSAPDPGAVSRATPNHPDHDAEPSTIRNLHILDYDAKFCAVREAIIHPPVVLGHVVRNKDTNYISRYQSPPLFRMCIPRMPLWKRAVPWVGGEGSEFTECLGRKVEGSSKGRKRRWEPRPAPPASSRPLKRAGRSSR
ncbi:Carbohydrate esterase 4 protein [Pleurotus pulmonarius]|nr:Carbohydrate esterase 4 protein [Pleurotus pulmonarius]